MSNEAAPLSGFIDTVKRVVSPKPVPTGPSDRDKALSTLRRELGLLPAAQRTRLSELSGIDENDLASFEKGKDLSDQNARALVPWLLDQMGLSPEWRFVNDHSARVSWNVAPKAPPRSPDIKIDALADLLSEPNYDHTVVLPDVIDCEALNLLSRLYSRGDERMTFQLATGADGLVTTSDVATFLRLYMKRVSETAGFAKLVSDLDYTISYTGDAARRLDACSTSLATKAVYARNAAGKYLAGREGAAIVKWRSVNAAMRQPKKDHRYVISPTIVDAEIKFLQEAIEGKATITVPLLDASLVVLARCRIA